MLSILDTKTKLMVLLETLLENSVIQLNNQEKDLIKILTSLVENKFDENKQEI